MAHWEYCLRKARRVIKREVLVIQHRRLYVTSRAERWGLVSTLIFCLLAGTSKSEPAEHAALTSAQQVLDLGIDAARRLVLPVHLQGLVTYPDPGVNLIYVQDSSAGILVSYTNANYQPASGQMVIVDGIAAGGTFAPFVDCANVRVAGSSLIPEPCEAPAARMAAGELFGQWVQIEGVVRDVAREPSRAILFVSSGGQRFHAVIQPFLETAAPVEWLEARVLLRGVCWTDVDAETKPIGFTLFVPGTNCVSIVRPGERNLFDRPALPVNQHPELHRQSDSRVKVIGVVTYQSPSGYVYLDSEGGPIRARLLVSPGSRKSARALLRTAAQRVIAPRNTRRIGRGADCNTVLAAAAGC